MEITKRLALFNENTSTKMCGIQFKQYLEGNVEFQMHITEEKAYTWTVNQNRESRRKEIITKWREISERGKKQ